MGLTMQQSRERSYKTEWMREWRKNNPDKQKIVSKRARIRAECRAEAIRTGVAAPVLYARYGVPTRPQAWS